MGKENTRWGGTDMNRKKCTRCQKRKTLSEFYKSKISKSGLDYRCSKCQIEVSTQYNLEHKEERREYGRRNRKNLSAAHYIYSTKNRGRLAGIQAKYRNSPKGQKQAIEYSKRYFSKPKNRERRREYQRTRYKHGKQRTN